MPEPASTPILRHPRVIALVLFAGYTLALLAATLWPNLRIENAPVERPDLYVHFAVFGMFQALLIACGFFGRPLGTRNLAVSLPVGLAFAAANEAAQGLPILGRTSAVDDFLANAGGMVIATTGLAAAGMWRRGVERSRATTRSS